MIGFADLTIEGSFSLGAAILAILVKLGIHPLAALIVSMLIGGIAGFFTAAMHCFLGINKLLSGIIMLTILYTVNLRIMGRPNFPLLDTKLLFDYFPTKEYKVLFLFLLVLCIFVFLLWFLSTKFGLYLRATGENPSVIKKSGFNPNIFILTGLVIANGLIAFCGGVMAQFQGFSDINMGGGLLVSMLTSLIIGENILKPTSILKLLLAALIGAVIFQAIIAVCLRLGIHPWDLKLAIGIFFVLTLTIEKLKKNEGQNQNIGSDFI